MDGADVLNAALYLMEGDLKNAGLSVGTVVAPIIGDILVKGGVKGSKYLMKVPDLTKLNRSKKVMKMLDHVDIFMKARKGDVGEI